VIPIEATHRQTGAASDGKGPRWTEGAVSPPHEDANLVGTEVRNRQIQIAIVVEISRDDGVRQRANFVIDRLLELSSQRRLRQDREPSQGE
jgi:hypothetical protein